MVVFEEVGVRRSEPCHGACDEHHQRRPLIDQGQHRLLPGTSCLDNVVDACWQMCNEEGEEDNGYPQLLQCDLANFCLVGREVVCEGC